MYTLRRASFVSPCSASCCIYIHIYIYIKRAFLMTSQHCIREWIGANQDKYQCLNSSYRQHKSSTHMCVFIRWEKIRTFMPYYDFNIKTTCFAQYSLSFNLNHSSVLKNKRLNYKSCYTLYVIHINKTRGERVKIYLQCSVANVPHA